MPAACGTAAAAALALILRNVFKRKRKNDRKGLQKRGKNVKKEEQDEKKVNDLMHNKITDKTKQTDFDR